MRDVPVKSWWLNFVRYSHQNRILGSMEQDRVCYQKEKGNDEDKEKKENIRTRFLSRSVDVGMWGWGGGMKGDISRGGGNCILEQPGRRIGDRRGKSGKTSVMIGKVLSSYNIEELKCRLRGVGNYCRIYGPTQGWGKIR